MKKMQKQEAKQQRNSNTVDFRRENFTKYEDRENEIKRDNQKRQILSSSCEVIEASIMDYFNWDDWLAIKDVNCLHNVRKPLMQ